MTRLTTRGILVSAALLLGTVGGTAAVSAATVTPSVHALRHPHRNFWRYWHRTHPRNLYVVESVSPAGGLFGEGLLTVENSQNATLTINLDNMSRAFVTDGLGGRGRYRIAPTSLTAGDFVVVLSEVIDVRSSAPTSNNGVILLALRINYTGFNPTDPNTPAPIVNPSASPTPAPTS